MSWIDSLVNDLNAVIDNREVATTVTTAAVLGVFGVAYRVLDRFLFHRKVVTVTPVFDQVVNRANPNLSILGPGRASADATERYPIESFAILRFANTGTEKISFEPEGGDDFQVQFPGRLVRVIKVREPEELDSHSGRATLSPGRFSQLHDAITSETCKIRDEDGVMQDKEAVILPSGVLLERKEAFQLAVFLESKDKDAHGAHKPIEVHGALKAGKIVFRTGTWWHRFLPAAVPIVLVLALAVSFGVGALTAHRALTPAASCAGDEHVSLFGSTAFAHVAAEAVADYERLCPAADIEIEPVGSDQALSAYRTQALPGDTVLMVDESGQAAPAGARANPVGVVIYAVVENQGDVTAADPVQGFDFYAAQSKQPTPGPGYTHSVLAQIYTQAAAGGVQYQAVGRTSDSGTALAFDQLTGLGQSVLGAAKACPAIGSTQTTLPTAPTSTGLCDVGTTQEMLQYVSDNPNALGFAEVDGLSDYPHLKPLPVDGYSPDRTDVNAGNYRFVVPEYLYASTDPSKEASSFLAFLQSPAEADRLAGVDDGYIPCDQLSSVLAGDC